MSTPEIVLFYLFFNDFIYFLNFFKRFYLFLEREGREKEKETNINVWLLFTSPNWGPGPQPRRVP